MNKIQQYVSNYSNTYIRSNDAKVGAAITAIASAEMLIRGLGNLMTLSLSNNQGLRNIAIRDLSANLGGAIVMGTCASNYLSPSAVLGATAFTLISTAVCEDQGAHISSQIIGRVVRRSFDSLFQAFKGIKIVQHPVFVWSVAALMVGGIVAKRYFPSNPNNGVST